MELIDRRKLVSDFWKGVEDGSILSYEDTDELMENAPAVDAVEVVQFNALKSLVNGEWVDCKLVQEALSIDFATGLKRFDFSRTAEWNPAPLNGQKITTKFRLKNAVVHGEWIPSKSMVLSAKCSECKGWVTKHSVNEPDFRYCPNCGAKMDGDEEEN